MVALERIKEYTELSQEAPEFVQPRPAASWPSAGEISVEKLVIKYSVRRFPPDLPHTNPASLNYPMCFTVYRSLLPGRKKSVSSGQPVAASPP
jgi:hypothetical protein